LVGLQERTCSKCGETETKTLPKVPNESTDSSGSNIGGSEFDDPNKDSTNSGNEVECDHKFGLWEVVEEPTEEKYGKKSRTCENCGKTETKRYNLGDVLNEETSSGGINLGCQSAMLSPLAGLTLLAGCGFFLKKRRNSMK
jgi:LPXTG-motif cell wall-anchored protein